MSNPLPPTICLALVQLERRFRRILTHIYLLFKTIIRTLRSGRPEKYVTALVALREMNYYVNLVIIAATVHLPQLHIPNER